MDSITMTILESYELFILILVRTMGIFVVSPLFSSENIPLMFKMGFSITSAVIITSIFESLPEYSDIWFATLIFKELSVGLIIGFLAYVFFTTFYVMGQIMDMKIGFGMVNVIDPQSRAQVPLTGNFYYIMAFLIFLSIDGHHTIIRALKESFILIPIGKFSYTSKTLDLIIRSIIETFEIGFKLSLPIVAVIFLTDIVLGVLARTIPQMNVFVVGMPLKLIIGLLILFLGFPVFFAGIESIFGKIVNYIDVFLNLS